MTVPAAATAEPATSEDHAAFVAEWRTWREERDRAVGAADGILAVTAIGFLGGAPTSVAGLPGRWSAASDGIVVDLAPDEHLFDGDERRTGRVVLERPAEGAAWRRRHEGRTVEVLHAGGEDVVRVRDASTPALRAFVGTPAFAPDRSWRLRGRWLPEALTVDVPSVVARVSRRTASPGVVEFARDGRSHRLRALPVPGSSTQVALVFRDLTSGVTTYAASRELLVELPGDAEGEVDIDFNRAYNKPCAYSDFALCPLPPAGNHLDIAVEAGEKLPYERGGSMGDGATDRSRDRSGLRSAVPPREIVVARDVDHVRETVRRAADEGVQIVVRGAGSGLTGGAVAGPDAIVLDLSGLDRILSIDPVDGTARVEAGVVTGDLDRAARDHGLIYAPDPGSVEISTIGGNIATNAGGLRGAKYGVTRDAVLSVDVVLADGSLVRVGRPTIKGVTGYDLAGLLVGSEGTLGVVVAATLRLLPRPVRVATASASFETLEEAAAAVAAIAVSGARPAVLEILDGPTLGAIDEAEGTSLRERGEALLLVQTDGFGAEEELAVVVAALDGTARVAWTADEAEGEALLFARRRALPAIELRGRALIEDIAVPRSRLVEAIRRIRGIERAHGVEIYVFGHAGDGNLHPIIVVDASPDAPIPEVAHRAAADIFALALELGGTVTAEHGVGRLKREWARRELGEQVVDLHRRIKAVFDPASLLSPDSGF